MDTARRTEEHGVALIEQVGAREILDSRGNPTVEVEVALDDGTLAIRVTDTGVGIDPASLARVFDPFFTRFDVSRHCSGVYEFDRRGLIRLQPAATNREYLNKLRAQVRLFPTAAYLTDKFDYFWYGKYTSSENDFNDFLSNYRRALDGSKSSYVPLPPVAEMLVAKPLKADSYDCRASFPAAEK